MSASLKLSVDDSETSLTLLLWGHTGAGKTSLLATALASNEIRQHISSEFYEMSDGSFLNLKQIYADLDQNRMPRSTSASYTIELPFRSGGQLVIQDSIGAFSTTELSTEARKLLNEADAILFVLPFEARDHMAFAAIKYALDVLDRKVAGVVFTKCEQTLKPNCEYWSSRTLNWWRNLEREDTHSALEEPSQNGLTWSKEQQELLLKFEGAVWPTSVYGFAKNGLPAMILDEFGSAIPFSINPKNTSEPFLWIFKKLGIIPTN